MISDYYPLAKEIILFIAKRNAAGDALDKYNLYVDMRARRLEITEGDLLPTTLDDSVLFGSLEMIDSSALLVESDAENKFIIENLSGLIESAEEYVGIRDDEETEDDGVGDGIDRDAETRDEKVERLAEKMTNDFLEYLKTQAKNCKSTNLELYWRIALENVSGELLERIDYTYGESDSCVLQTLWKFDFPVTIVSEFNDEPFPTSEIVKDKIKGLDYVANIDARRPLVKEWALKRIDDALKRRDAGTGE